MQSVPFVARIPGGAKGHVVSEQIQLFDLMPTVLELSRKTPKPTRNTHFARSLVPQLMGAKGDASRIGAFSFTFSQHGLVHSSCLHHHCFFILLLCNSLR